MDIKSYLEYPLSGSEILALLFGKVRVILYPNIVDYYSISSLLGEFKAVVILYIQDKVPKGGFYGHWCCLFMNGANKLEFFDPLGVWVDDELNINMKKQFRKEHGLEYPLLSYLLYADRDKYDLTYNEFQFQERSPSISTCGRHCVFRLLNRHLSLYEYKDLVDSYNTTPDILVTLMTI